MTAVPLRIAGAVLSLLLIVVSGAWLGISGKPYNRAVVNIHKLVSLAALVVLGITVYQIGKATGLTNAQLTSAIVTGILFLGTIISGGLSSIGTMPVALVRVHQVTLFLTALSGAVALYLFLQAR